ncbi:uncharacterized protein FFB20_07386 [Fusarium fujikuroi]|nr:uncharacterized protein Y057_14984 [Fusarium fujikuroi]SCN85186.1 uncharacterized protein FFB20_07386 [Fusarium fujikuroi]SCO20829.1 uncharacterized protein FFC1_13854 [Fusarium fujikuroi]SCO45578.1 uncharacterized protein FFNC_10373 [Fusarium fujikuroi]
MLLRPRIILLFLSLLSLHPHSNLYAVLQRHYLLPPQHLHSAHRTYLPSGSSGMFTYCADFADPDVLNRSARLFIPVKSSKMSYSSEHSAKASDGLEMVSTDEFLRRLGPEGRRSFVATAQKNITTAQNNIAAYEEYASRYPIETAYDNIQLRGIAKTDGTSITKSSQDMDNVVESARLLERLEALEAFQRAMEEKTTDLEDMQLEERIEALEASLRDLSEKVAEREGNSGKQTAVTHR